MPTGVYVRTIRPKPYYSTQEVADLLGMSRPWVTRAMDRGEIPCYRLPTRWRRVDRRRLREWVRLHPDFAAVLERAGG